SWEIALEPEDVLVTRSPPGVDRLIVVPDHADVSQRTDEKLQEPILRRRRVLKLIHENAAEPLVILAAYIRVGTEQLEGEHDQIIEVHGIVHSKVSLVFPEKRSKVAVFMI